MYLLIKFTDGTEQKEYSHGNPFITKERMLMIPKGDYAPSLFINLDFVKSYQEIER